MVLQASLESTQRPVCPQCSLSARRTRSILLSVRGPVLIRMCLDFVDADLPQRLERT